MTSTVGGGTPGSPGAALSGRIRHDGRRLAHDRQPDAEDGAPAVAVVGLEASAVRLDDRAGDREPQARAAGARSAEELLEDPRQHLRRDARAAVGDLDDDVGPAGPRLGSRGDLDRRARRRVAHGVLEQVDEDLLDEHPVHEQHGQVGRQARGHGVVDEPRADRAQRRAHDLLQRLPLAPGHERARLEARHVEQVAHEAGEAVGLVVDAAQHRAPRLGVEGIALGQQRAAGAGDDRERRAQVVAHEESRAERVRSASASTSTCWAVCASWSRSSARRDLVAQRLDELALLGRADRQPLVRRERHHPDGPARRRRAGRRARGCRAACRCRGRRGGRA
jgi:hypothetical protein